jgi:hypothetical protein
MDERLPGHTDYLMQYEELLGAARGRLDPSALMRYESRDLARANGGVNQPWHVSSGRGAGVRLWESPRAHVFGLIDRV